MKRFVPWFIMVMLMVLATACGSPAQPATQPPSASPAPTANIETQVVITLKDNTIESSRIEFQTGVLYTFVITNAGRHAHNFNISTPVSVTGSLNASADGALLKVDQEQLSPGTSMTVEYTFPDSTTGQPLEFSCLIKRHYDDKMYLAIAVTK